MDYSLEKRKTPVTPNNLNTKARSPDDTQKQAKARPVTTKQGKKYTEDDMQTMLEGYFGVHRALWDHIPNGAHIRYIRRDSGDNLPRNERFKPGGFVNRHFVTEDGKKMLMIETRIGGKKGDPGYISFPLCYDDIENLWKKYDRSAFVEIHLIYSTMVKQKMQIEELNSRIKRLEDILKGLVRK
ncbi:Hypothetical protein PACV_163 [Pacmanvirus A23]|uniref:Hypothetical protein n=1 Tax=Pacmanvirus A23 TaxID=1932881 RepID=UPI000A092D3A|nr:Hypothetical protein B9W72_gp161 [Pacmanvirus A23]SIP85878.1 Hypothetical protein PACV_163 [Pacmanvirus A23]